MPHTHVPNQSARITLIVCTLPFSAERGVGLEPPIKSSKSGGALTQRLFFEGDCWHRGCDCFQGGCKFYIKNKLKPEIFNNKKVYEE